MKLKQYQTQFFNQDKVSLLLTWVLCGIDTMMWPIRYHHLLQINHIGQSLFSPLLCDFEPLKTTWIPHFIWCCTWSMEFFYSLVLKSCPNRYYIQVESPRFWDWLRKINLQNFDVCVTHQSTMLNHYCNAVSIVGVAISVSYPQACMYLMLTDVSSR